ncbi:hypothetical protein TNIN_203492 [Trichonephila inaurata madagascariensis]|uniref:Uncharacterized protein n=1 Tax=Trichonephila inaurata madagascariensis TaxID=2747483 RepID=A0A8X6WTL9_9ARAC|nr:hypothetical protein TNIN_203492 [Trichonephila inaurata madagascariensis]
MVVISVKSEEAMTAVPSSTSSLPYDEYYLCVLSSLLMVPILAIVLSKVQEPKKLTIVLFTLLIIFFIAEMASFYGMSTFDNASKGVFTHEICAYIHGMNMVASVVLFLICCSLFLDF